MHMSSFSLSTSAYIFLFGFSEDYLLPYCLDDFNIPIQFLLIWADHQILLSLFISFTFSCTLFLYAVQQALLK